MNTGMINLMLLGGFIILIYFMMIRPQRKMDKENKAMRDGLKSGDEIITIGGIMAKVAKVKEKSVVITVGEGKTKMEILKTAVASVKKDKNAPEKAEKAEPAAEKTPNRDKKVVAKKLTAHHEENAPENTEEKDA